MDRIQAMQVFARVVETGSFTRTAEALGLQKGMATRLVQRLEANLQVQLLHRTTRRVSVTSDGAAFYERASRILDELAEAEASMRSVRATPSGRLRVDVGSTISKLLIIPALAEFYTQYPDIQLELGVGDRPVDLRRDGVDCVIRGGDIVDDSLIARRIGTVRLITVAAPAYIDRHGVPEQPLQIESSEHRVVTYLSWTTGRPYPLTFERQGRLLEVMGRHRIALNDVSAHTEAALAGYGIAQIADYSAQPHIQAGRLARLLPDWTAETIPLHAVYPPDQRHSARVRAFVDWAARLCDRHPLLRTQRPVLAAARRDTDGADAATETLQSH